MVTLGSVVAYLALMLRCTGIAYTASQVLIWHSFYAAAWWRLAVPALAAAWAVTITVGLRKGWPSPSVACLDSAFYAVLALTAQASVPPGVRDGAFSWLVISMSGQLIFSVWYAPRALFVPLALLSPVAYCAGAMTEPVTDRTTLVRTAILLALIGGMHAYGRRKLCARAVAADDGLERADRAASEQFAILSAAIERREHERLLHDTVLNTLTALTRAGDDNVAEAVNRCRQDVALIETALGGPDDLAAGTSRPPGDLVAEVRAVVAGMRSRGLSVHVEADDGDALEVPARVTGALSNAMREALSNVAAHAGTGEAWVEVRVIAARGDAKGVGRLEVTIRDRGIGFDLANVNGTRLGLRRSIAERVADCGGRASVWSEPGRGTVVRLAWPASEPPAEPAWAGHVEAGWTVAQESQQW
jgi:signal transduction histidine kinase